MRRWGVEPEAFPDMLHPFFFHSFLAEVPRRCLLELMSYLSVPLPFALRKACHKGFLSFLQLYPASKLKLNNFLHLTCFPLRSRV